jgi:catechol 2,3-dioxygenase-like lactoylglutathione lyase family enzyme
VGIPSGTELVRAFLPTRDLERSKRFYVALGFDLLLEDDEVVIFAAGSGGLLLQRHFHEDWAANCMMRLMVDDLDAWWDHIERLGLVASFGVSAPTPPAVQPWGLRIAYVVDPAGVLWHVAERRPDTVHD